VGFTVTNVGDVSTFDDGASDSTFSDDVVVVDGGSDDADADGIDVTDHFGNNDNTNGAARGTISFAAIAVGVAAALLL